MMEKPLVNQGLFFALSEQRRQEATIPRQLDAIVNSKTNGPGL
jgi:hypothetical protein